jgi:TrmH family RNA methyltransferase
MQYQTIDSKDNTLIKKIVKLATSKSYRYEQGLAVIYGQHLVEEAIKYNLLDSILILDTAIDQIPRFYQQFTDKPIKRYCVSAQVMHKINVLDTMSDIVGVIRIPNLYKEESCVDLPNTVIDAAHDIDCIILDNIQDPGNLGTILRTALATGFCQAIISANSVDVYNPKVLRASQGMQLGLSVFTGLTENAIIDFIAKYQGKVILTTPHADQLIYNVDLKHNIALVFGNEGSGLDNQLLTAPQNLNSVNNLLPVTVKIPMCIGAESLNVAMAATVCMFEAVRQRL